MRRNSFVRLVWGVIAVAGITFGAGHVISAQQVIPNETSEAMLTYSRGQGIIPAYHGWHPNGDGTIDVWFGYLNLNWREELDIPVGPNNFISPEKYGPDVGQPTHFLPRHNRFIFKVTVPEDFPEKEIVWTVTAHGKTFRAYGTLHPGYVKDHNGMQREYFGFTPAEGNEYPEIKVEGDLTRNIKVGEVSTLTVVATDDGVPSARGRRRPTAGAAQRPGPRPDRRSQRGSICGDNRDSFFCGEPNESGGNMFNTKGLRMQCFLYQGGSDAASFSTNANLVDHGQAAFVTFDPPQAKAWEDHRNGSPWAVGYRLPEIPADDTWNISTRFAQPGTYVVRCQAHDGLLISTINVTFNVTRNDTR